MLVSMLSCRMSCISTGGMTSPPPADLPGNRLDVDLTGVINPVLAENFIAGAGYSGSWTFGGGIQPVTFETIETLTPTSTLTVTKTDGEWQHLKPAILGAIMEHFMSGAPVVARAREASDGDEFFAAEDADTVATIKELIETRVRPAVAQDGGDITFRGFRDGVVFLNMRGSCAGCPSSTATLKHGIENLLRHFVPEVREIAEA